MPGELVNVNKTATTMMDLTYVPVMRASHSMMMKSIVMVTLTYLTESAAVSSLR